MPASRKFPHLPAQVYLDSADFSNLSNTKLDQEWRSDVIARLRTAVNASAIQLRFSAVHIIEAVPLSLDVVEPGVARLRMIRELCGRHALRYFTNLAEEELRVRSKGLSLIAGRVHADEGRWMPGMDDFVIDLEKDKRDFIKQVRGLPRDQRRRLLLKNGTGVRIGVGREAELRQMFELGRKYPGFERCITPFRRFYMGEVEAEAVEDEFLRAFAEPHEFAKVYLQNFDQMEKMVSWLRELGEKNISRFTDLRDHLWSSEPEWTNERKSAHAEEIYRQFREDFLFGKNEQIIRAFLGEQSKFVPFSDLEDVRRNAPTYFAFADASMTIFSRSVLPPNHPRKLKRSDVGDGAHAAYIPHVDFFRCDSAMADCFRDLGRRFDTLLVPSFDELLERLGL